MRPSPRRHRPRSHRLLDSLVFLKIAILGALLFSAPEPALADKDGVPRLDSLYGAWLDATAPWMTADERQAFEALDDDRGRELFIRAFWNARTPDLLPGGSLEEWWRRFAEARRRFGDLDNDRARTLLTAGIPAEEQVFGGCRGVLRPLRIWHYDRHQAEALGLDVDPGAADGGFDVVFRRDYDAEDGLFRLWSRLGDGTGALSEDDAPWRRDVKQIVAFSRDRRCFRDGDREERVVTRALLGAVDLEALRAAAAHRTPPPQWLSAFRTDLQSDALQLPAERVDDPVAIGYPGRDAAKVLTLGRIQVPTETLQRGAAGQLFDRLRLLGEVHLGPHVADRFEHIYHLSGPSPPGDTLELDFYRRLRPGDYELRLRLEDPFGQALLRRDLILDVPILDGAPRILDDQRPAGGAALRDLTRRRVLSMIHFPGLDIVPPASNAVGDVELRVVASGGDIDLVELSLNGAKVAEDGSPPYRFPVDLGPTPEAHRLEATAFDAAGRIIARTELQLEPAARPLAVALRRLGDELEARVSVPDGETLSQLELSLDGLNLAALGPHEAVTETAAGTAETTAVTEEDGRLVFRVPLPETLAANRRFIRAAVKTEAGATAEQLLFLDTETPLEAVQVRWIEVYATVLDAAGRPVVGLDADDFRIEEDGREQSILRFERVEDLPLQVMLAMDISESMRDRLSTAVKSARRFFETVVTPKDRAALVTFNHDLRLAVPFTDDVGQLALGASGLAAWGGTRLHDAVIFSSGYVGGHEGRRALVLLTDGHDVESDFDAEEALDFAVRAGLAVYPILLGGSAEGTRRGLEKLAQESGGRAFAIRTIAQLDGVYRRIEEELRSQYLLVYQAPRDGGGIGDTAPGAEAAPPQANPEPGSFRRIDVTTTRAGLTTRALRGYYR
ncbi:MAG: VWA domain-containing protein [Acidobacteriota bacterium]